MPSLIQPASPLTSEQVFVKFSVLDLSTVMTLRANCAVSQMANLSQVVREFPSFGNVSPKSGKPLSSGQTRTADPSSSTDHQQGQTTTPLLSHSGWAWSPGHALWSLHLSTTP